MVNEVIKSMNEDCQMTNERVGKIVERIFSVDDVDFMDTVFEDNYIYYKKEGSKEFFVNKSDEDSEGFVINFNIWDEDNPDEDMINDVVVTDIKDIYGVIAIIAKFDKDPYEVMEKLGEYDND